MAQGAKPLHELLADIKYLLERGRGDEPAILYMPRVEAQRRKANKEKSCRVVFVCTPETKSEFETQRDRYITLCVNKEVAFTVMCDLLAKVPDELVKRIAEAGHEQQT